MQTWILLSKDFWAANGQQTDSKRTSDVWTANGYKSAHVTVCALKHRTTVCCLFAVQCMDFFLVIIDCILRNWPKVLFSWFSLNFLFLLVPIYRSTVYAQTDSKRSSEIFVNPFVHKRTANWRPQYSSTVCAQVFGWRFVHKCSSA